jgi:enolase-phosphatase E1
VTSSLRGAGIKVVLLDIEGTTTPVSFVYNVLFPYARARLASWLAARSPSDPEAREIVESLRRESAGDGLGELPAAPTHDQIVARLHAYMDQDRKSPALKMVQGRIWEAGYADGTLAGEVYPDVPDAFARWTAGGVFIGIYSSGSVLAQKLLFGQSNAGDLTTFIRWYFDTAVGAKVDASSYRRIVESVGAAASSILFVSDVTRELEAARDAGLKTILCVRAPAPGPASAAFPVIRSFDEVERALSRPRLEP